MLAIVNGVIFDTKKSIHIITVQTTTGAWQLFATGYYNFFVVEPSNQLTPMDSLQAFEFLEQHKNHIPKLRLTEIIKQHLPARYAKQPFEPIPKHAREIAAANGEHLLYYARRFYLMKGTAGHRIPVQHALRWIEKYQDHINLETAVRYFHRIKKSWLL